MAYDSVYDIVYHAQNGQYIEIYDTLNDSYSSLEPPLLKALVRAHFRDPELAEKVLMAVFAARKVRVSFATGQAAVAPSPAYDFSALTLKTMFESYDLRFPTKEAQREHFWQVYGVQLL